jgi:ligand-binding sensor domain-containing protein
MATNLRAQQYPFLPVDHSPKNIERILEDRQGRLWIATHDDVLCFDGSRFFSLRDYGLPATPSYSLIEDNDGGILSGMESGIYRYYHGRLEHIVSGVSYEIPISMSSRRLTGFASWAALGRWRSSLAERPESI